MQKYLITLQRKRYRVGLTYPQYCFKALPIQPLFVRFSPTLRHLFSGGPEMSTSESGLSLIRTIATGVLSLLMVIGASSKGGAGKSAVYMPDTPATTKYSLDASQSKFIAHAFAGGLFWFKGHDRYVAAKDFSGEVEITTESLTPASLRLVVKSGSLVETGAVFTEPQKQIINKELREIVLPPEQYPEII